MNPLQLQIFFVGYLAGYLLCTVCLDVGVKAYNEQLPQQHMWILRKEWRWRLLTSKKWGKFIIALYSLAWPYLMLAGLWSAFHQKTEEPFDFNRLRHCADPLWQLCESSPPWFWALTLNRCHYNDRVVFGEGFQILREQNPLCITGLMTFMNRCIEPEYDYQMCQGVALQ